MINIKKYTLQFQMPANCIKIVQVCIESQWRRRIVFLVTFCRSGHHEYVGHDDEDLDHFDDDDDDDLDDEDLDHFDDDVDDGDAIGEGGGGGEDEQRGGDRGGRPQTPHGGGDHLHHQHDHDHHDDDS